MIQQITNHIEAAKKRLLEQYKGKARMEGLIHALVTPIQPIEDSFFQLLNDRYLETSVGFQLDRLGDIVGIARDGLNDDQYRLRIKARIFVNVSNGEPETLILVYKLLTLSNLVILEELFPAAVGLMCDGPDIPDPEDVQFIADLMEAASLAGVRVDFLGVFDEANPFAFDGVVLPLGDGFGDTGNPATGGLFGKLYDFGMEFAFAGDDPKPEGFGTTVDPLVGGRLVGL
jgi:hypothetical protein